VPSDGATFGLKWLLGPVTPDDFFARNYETEPLAVKRDDLHYYADLPGLDAIDELLVATVSDRREPGRGERLVRTEPSGTLSERVLRLTEGAAVDIQMVYRLYHDGFTLVVNQMHRRSTSVGRLCRSLQAALHHRVGANLYLTPAGAQGFLPHVDTHDVFVLQLEGAKEWHVAKPTTTLPMPVGSHRPQTLPDARSYLLEPGDLLYLPRGFRHEAIAADSSSLHLTVGFYTVRWHELCKEILDVLAEQDVLFRHSLPPQYADDPLDMERVAELARRLTVALADDAIVDKAKQRIASRLVTTDASVGPSHFRSLDALAGLTDDSIVTRPPELLCLVRTTSDQATIEFAGNFVAGPRYLVTALEFIAGKERFAVSQLPGIGSPGDRIDLVKRLVSEGLLEVLS
jgi:bifunctional lysine-specific demethylase and histidyl-hydroxylase NO66